jgi:hypothetical protein
MRLSLTEQQQFIHLTTQYFGGQSARLYEFGSRAEDNKKGGDIDLFIETDGAVSM